MQAGRRRRPHPRRHPRRHQSPGLPSGPRRADSHFLRQLPSQDVQLRIRRRENGHHLPLARQPPQHPFFPVLGLPHPRRAEKAKRGPRLGLVRKIIAAIADHRSLTVAPLNACRSRDRQGAVGMVICRRSLSSAARGRPHAGVLRYLSRPNKLLRTVGREPAKLRTAPGTHCSEPGESRSRRRTRGIHALLYLPGREKAAAAKASRELHFAARLKPCPDTRQHQRVGRASRRRTPGK